MSITSTISLGKYGSFPSNLIIHRPFYLTYELHDKLDGESSSRLRVVPASELHVDVLAEESSPSRLTPAEENDQSISATDRVEYSLVDQESGAVVARSTREILDADAQTLTYEEIEELKKDGSAAGREIITKLLLSHTALDQKTSYSLAKYKLLKTKKYIRRFQVLPLDVPLFGRWMLEEKDASRVLDMTEEMLALVGCLANVHYGGEDVFLHQGMATGEEADQELLEALDEGPQTLGGRWLVVDDTGGLLVAAMAERMGILYPEEQQEAEEDKQQLDNTGESRSDETPREQEGNGSQDGSTMATETTSTPGRNRRPRHPTQSDFWVPYSQTNTITLVHAASQPKLSFLTYYGFDITDPNHAPHPLVNHLLTLTWLQLINPSADTSYSTAPLTATPAELASWKPNRRGNYHRKRRRYTRTRHAVDSARAGNFAGFVCATTMEPISMLRRVLPLLAGGAPVAIYSASIEPLTELADCFSVGRRAAWASEADRPAALEGRTTDEIDRWEGSAEFPINPTLLLGVSIQTSRARKWQVLPGRTHPVMTAKGGADGYVFTGWRARPLEGPVAARGKFNKKRKVGPEKAVEVGGVDLDGADSPE
jgi:tRNA (adenine-N(1)-)-methyltransferase non-catalytic subunit